MINIALMDYIPDEEVTVWERFEDKDAIEHILTSSELIEAIYLWKNTKKEMEDENE